MIKNSRRIKPDLLFSVVIVHEDLLLYFHYTLFKMSIPSMEEAARARRQRLLDQDREELAQNRVQPSTSTPSFKRPLPKSTSTPSKDTAENNILPTTDTVEKQANQLLEELSKSGILGEGMGKKKLTIDELAPRDANTDLKRMLEEKSKRLEEETKKAMDELARRNLTEAFEK